MTNDSSHIIKLKEGGADNYMEALVQKLGGTMNGNRVLIEQGLSRICVSSYTYLDEFDLIVAQINYHQEIIVEREPDERADFYHFNLINQGQIKQNYQDSLKYTQAGSSNGIFLYNGLFPFTSAFPQRSDTQSIGYKFSKKALGELMPEAIGLLDSLFGDEEPKAYHTAINSELDKMLDELFYYENADYGRIPLAMARGLDILPVLMKTLKSQLDQDELNGLHLDDYNRLLKIKGFLLSNLERKVNIEDIASQFGISDSKLKRDFKTLFNTTIYKFYTHAKMDEAYRRLRTGNYSVMEVGYDLGYQNLSKFSQMFKKVKGINPKEVIPL
ncbi:AraC family transcriptional regulator [Prolixibacteraceae bacterium Z1-6]|uniref:AraC family transcriptional regulator n=1 Tax=Draconibacterium aestuarii TaxID=2998507 RepID=A0A9X3FF62_9BACT|nr:AraC family transcriptional regulator [Prolixibacteraceae bacterium Z1-6]